MILTWYRGEPVAWDVTIPDTFADSHMNTTTTQAGSAANNAANSKTTKYADLTATYVFMPTATEKARSWNQQAIDAIEDIGRRISVITEEPLESIHLLQRISVAIQLGNAVSFMSTFDDEAIPTML